MKSKMSRRAFLMSSITGVLAAATGIWAFKSGYFVTQSRMERTILVVFEKRLSYLKWEKTEVLTFIKDFLEKYRKISKIQYFSYLYPLYAYTNWLEKTPLAREIRSFEEHVTTRFLLSTHFFQNGADETQPVKYLSYYDPRRKHPCQNPFAQWW